MGTVRERVFRLIFFSPIFFDQTITHVLLHKNSEDKDMLKLNVYEKREIKKTYVAETYELMFGTVEDVLKLIKFDELKTGSNAEIIKMVGATLINGLDDVKYLLFDIFDGLNEDELRNVKISEIAIVLVDVVKFAIAQMNANINSKN